VSSTAPSTPGATATPSPPFAVRPLRILEDIEFPDNWQLVYASGGYRHGSGLIHIHRSYRAGGDVHHEQLTQALGEGQQIRSATAAENGVPIVLSLCRGDACGSEGGPKPNVTTTFLQSDDLGVTWRSIGERPGEWWIHWNNGRVEAYNPENWDAASGNLVEPLDGSPPFRVAGDLWEAEPSPSTQIPLGATLGTYTSVYDPERGRDRNFTILRTTSGLLESPRDTVYFAEFDSFGRLTDVLGPLEVSVKSVVRQPFDITPVEFLPDNQLLVVADFVREANCTAEGLHFGNAYAILDIRNGTLAFIRDFVETSPAAPCGWLPGGAVVSLAVDRANYLSRVNTGGSCLNLRRSYGESHEVLDCAADGTLLSGARTSGKCRRSPVGRVHRAVAAGRFLGGSGVRRTRWSLGPVAIPPSPLDNRSP